MRKSINTKIAQVVLLSFGFMEKLVAARPAPPVPNPKKGGPPTLPPGAPIDDFLVLLAIIAILTAFYFLKYNHKKSS